MCRCARSAFGDPVSLGAEKNPALAVYDTSGPYTDPSAKIDIRRGLPSPRAAWIAERNDTIELDGPTSGYGRTRLADPQLAGFRFDLARTPRRAKPGANVSQMHYARRGIVTPEMEFVAIRENLKREEMLATMPAIVMRQHAGQNFGAAIPAVITPAVRTRRGRPRSRDHPQPTSTIRKASR